ncbi:unnamed protein product [Ceutorhynchus assimilis]|uniref:Carboxylic ester hydrolase n=1 Tax=Ceutorhynchus assimilis TaxID=467358 RepID=A0A9N9MMN2_9CUCU|nr:unnamed protein product [Ceutorhynchus assimilis]
MMMFVFVSYLFAVLIGLATCQGSLDGPTVKIPQGLVQGIYKKSYKNKTYSAFEGIPYAVPPVGDLRFKPPQAAAKWTGVLKANKHYECLHFLPLVIVGPRGTEDCLYAYVYVPRETINPNELLDVIVHIHGGAFMMGSPKFMVGPEFLMDRDAIVVSMNYRLGILGFLSTEDDVVPGNNGLKDQSLALEWIKHNIKYFGGNPASITITGLSAGAASVHLHYFSQLSKGLFHRGFSQSGTALNCWALTENPLEKAKAVAKNVSCTTSSSKKMVECLRQVEGNALIQGLRTLFVYMDAVPITPFGPIVEKNPNGAFLSEHPYKMLQKGDVYDVPWITSNTKDEGLFPVGLIFAGKKFSEFEEKWYDIMQYALEMHYTVKPSLHREVLSNIKKYYFKDQPISEDNMFSFVKLFSDRMFLVDAEKSVRMHANATQSEVYYYLFSYIEDMPHFPFGMPKGASHGDDGRLMFKMFLTPPKLSDNDEQMMEYFADFIINFARKGIPSMKSVEWLPVKPDKDSNINYLQIADPDTISMKSVARLAPDDFWDSLPIRENENAMASSSDMVQGKFVIISIVLFVINAI